MTLTCTGWVLLYAQLTCVQTGAPVPVSDFCTRYQPIRWAATDTRETKEQVDRMNRRWKAGCRAARK